MNSNEAHLNDEINRLTLDNHALRQSLYEVETISKSIEEQLAYINEQAKLVAEEQCRSDEKHCTCVVLLREEIRKWKVRWANDCIGAHMSNCSTCICHPEDRCAEVDEAQEILKEPHGQPNQPNTGTPA